MAEPRGTVRSKAEPWNERCEKMSPSEPKATLVAVAGHDSIGNAGNEAVKPNEKPAAMGQDDLVLAFANRADGFGCDDVRWHRSAFLPVLASLVFDRRIEKFAVSRTGTYQQQTHIVRCKFGSNRIAKPVQRKFARTIFTLCLLYTSPSPRD